MLAMSATTKRATCACACQEDSASALEHRVSDHEEELTADRTDRERSAECRRRALRSSPTFQRAGRARRVMTPASTPATIVAAETFVREALVPSERCPRQELNLHTRFRKPLLCPLSYGGEGMEPCMEKPWAKPDRP